MNSPPKRGADVLNPSGDSASKIIKTNEFPLIRSRSPKKEGRATGISSKRRRDDANKPIGLPRVGTKVSYEKSGEDLPQVLDSGEELEVLKCILVREGYLQRLASASAQGKISGSQLSETIDVLDLLRVATIDVVEAIVSWRIKQQRQQQHSHASPEASVFAWNSINYLLKIASDLDFLEKHQGLIQWLGFTLVRNPFILPVSLNTRIQLDDNTVHASPGHIRTDDPGSHFVQVGGKRTAINQGQEAMSALRAAKAAALAERKRAKNPYETRIINDEELVPLARAGARTSSAISDRPSSRMVAHVHVELPSQIGELDMARIHACEKIVLQEEAVHGRYTHDIKGQLVPESEAIRRRNMSELSGDAYAGVDGDHTLKGKRDVGISEQLPSAADRRGDHAAVTVVPPHVHAKKRAGMLGPISKPQLRKPVRKAPVDRSRGAHLEEALRQERRANLDLGLLIDRVREEIERKEMDLAYFESFAGVQLYGNELDEFRKKTYAEVALLRRDVAEKEYIYKSRTANLNRKEEIIQVFKTNHKSAVDVERSTRLENAKGSVSSNGRGATNQEKEQPSIDFENGQSTEQPEKQHDSLETTSAQRVSQSPMLPPRAFAAPLVHDMCATLIQKIARGKLARAAFEILKIEYYVGSKYIQAVVRGFLARRRVAKMYWQLTASVILQRFARGMLARRFVARRRDERAMQQAALRIQRTLRGHFGRMRMKRVRRLYAGRKQLLCSVDELKLSDLKELADACAKMAAVPSAHNHLKKQAPVRPLTSLVLGLVRIVMVLTTDRDDDVDVARVRWKEAAQFLRCSSRLQRRVGKVAGVAATGDRHLRQSLLGSALLQMYSKDEDFNERTFASLETGWQAALVLYRWVNAFHSVCQEQGVLKRNDALTSKRPFLFAESTDKIEAMQERVEEEENTIRAMAVERRFVPRELVCSGKHRTRAMLLVVAFDVPQAARRSVIDQLRSALPGVFVVINRRHSHPDNVGTDGEQQPRLAKARKKQLEILGADYTSVRESLAVGHSVILDCDIGLTDAKQHEFIGAFTALKASIKPSPMCLLLRGSLRNRPVLEDVELSTSSPRARKQADATGRREMVDTDIKRAFEQRADWQHRLSQPESAVEMLRTSASDASSSAVALAFVLVMEAVVILLTPSKRYEAPQPHTSGVSWKLAKRLLANPPFFVNKLASVEYDTISSDNLRALTAYLSHSSWPQPVVAYGAGSGLLHALASWVRSVVTCAQMAVDRHGLAPNISRSIPVAGLFDNVVVYNNVVSCDHNAPAYQELLDASLADVRVYRKVHTLDTRRCVVSVYHDCQHLYFSAYDPLTSWRWQRIVPEEEVDMLLAPNSVERGEDAALKRQPPATQDEMYDRLVRLCLLQSMATKTTGMAETKNPLRLEESPTAESMNPETKQLIVRPPAIRLFRRALHLGGHRVTVTLAELSRGRIQVDVTVHSLSLALRRVVSLEEILERLSHREARDVFIPPERLPALVLERLHLFRRVQSTSSLSPNLSTDGTDRRTSSPLRLGVRTKEAVPGRVVLRKAIRSQWLNSTGRRPEVWVFTVLELHSDDHFRAEIYQPQSSERFSRVLSKREFQDLRLPELCQHPSGLVSALLLRAIVKLFQFEKDPTDHDAAQALIVSCTLRHHILARFPLGVRFVVNPHHAVEKGGVIRTYVQVETKELDTKQDGVRFRVFFPESCEEQALDWQDEEVDSFFSTYTASWTTALHSERKRLAFELAHHVFQWDPSKKRIVAELPCGIFEASVCTRDTGRCKAATPSIIPTRSKKSVFSTRSSRALLPTSTSTSTSCIQLLDVEDGEGDQRAEAVKLKNVHLLFVYDRDELVHSGSYRANGVLVTVQVFMKAVVVSVPKPRLPVDRLEQEDSFELAFDFYHPSTSTSQRCVIYGRTQLREVVGPDKASLIASATVHELLEHIIEARTSVHFERMETKTKTQAEAKRMVISFVRDRLYAKHKITPLQKTLHADAIANAPKLIDAKPDRGLKLLTRTKTLADDSEGKVILSVFDVRHTRPRRAGDDEERDPHPRVQLRVDGYVVASSTRLSLSLEAADLVHILNDEMANLLREAHGSRNETTESDKQRLAQLVIDHIGVERKRDGTPDRLFLVETLTTSWASHGPITTDQPGTEKTSHQLVGKTVRQVRHVPVVITVYAIGDISCEGFEIECYEPQTSTRTSLVVQPAMVGLGGNDVGSLTMLATLNSATVAALVTQILAHIHVDAAEEGTVQDNLNRLVLTVNPDSVPDSETQCRTHFQRLIEGSASTSGGLEVRQHWRGLVAAVSAGHELCVVHVAVQTPPESHDRDAVDVSSARAVYVVLALRKGLVSTRVITGDELRAVLSRDVWSADEFLRECVARLRIHVLPPLPTEKDDVGARDEKQEEAHAYRLVIDVQECDR